MHLKHFENKAIKFELTKNFGASILDRLLSRSLFPPVSPFSSNKTKQTKNTAKLERTVAKYLRENKVRNA